MALRYGILRSYYDTRQGRNPPEHSERDELIETDASFLCWNDQPAMIPGGFEQAGGRRDA